MNLGRSFAAFVRDQRIFETPVIETNRFRRFRKKVDDRSAAEPERAFVDDQVVRWAAVEQDRYIHAVGFTRGYKIEQRLSRAFTIAIELIETEIEEEILFRKSEVLEQQHVSGMDVRRVWQH